MKDLGIDISGIKNGEKVLSHSFKIKGEGDNNWETITANAKLLKSWTKRHIKVIIDINDLPDKYRVGCKFKGEQFVEIGWHSYNGYWFSALFFIALLVGLLVYWIGKLLYEEEEEKEKL